MPRLLSHPQRTPVVHGQKAKGWAHCENAPHPDFWGLIKLLARHKLFLSFTNTVLQVLMQQKTLQKRFSSTHHATE